MVVAPCSTLEPVSCKGFELPKFVLHKNHTSCKTAIIGDNAKTKWYRLYLRKRLIIRQIRCISLIINELGGVGGQSADYQRITKNSSQKWQKQLPCPLKMEDWKTVFRYFLHDSGRYKFGGKSKHYFS